MSSTTASSGQDARYIRVRAQLAGTPPHTQRRRRIFRLLLPLAALLLVATWVVSALDRFADAGLLRHVGHRAIATSGQTREIVGAWRGIADVLADSTQLPEDEAIDVGSMRDALDRFRWWVPPVATGPAPLAKAENPGTPIDEAVTGNPAPAPVAPHAIPPKAVPAPPPPPPQVDLVVLPAGEQPIATVRDPVAVVPALPPVRKASAPAAEPQPKAPPALKSPPPEPKRKAQPAPERPRVVTKRAPSGGSGGSGGTSSAAGQAKWADDVTRRQEAP